MFGKLALAAVPLIAGDNVTEGSPDPFQLNNCTASVNADGDSPKSPIDLTSIGEGKSSHESMAILLFNSARTAGVAPPSTLEAIGPDEIATIVAAYRQSRSRSDEAISRVVSQLRGVFSRTDWDPVQNGSSVRVSRDADSNLITFENVGTRNGDASYEVRALTYDFLIQLGMFERLPENEIKELVGFMMAASDGNPGVDTEGTRGLFRLTDRQFESAAGPLFKAWEKKTAGKVDLPIQIDLKDDGLEGAANDPFLQTVSLVSLYLESRQEVKSSDKRGVDTPAFQAKVWQVLAGKLARAELADAQSEELTQLTKQFSNRQSEISKTLKGEERKSALKALQDERSDAEVALKKGHAEEIAKVEESVLARVKSGGLRLKEKGVGTRPRIEVLQSYLRLIQVNNE